MSGCRVGQKYTNAKPYSVETPARWPSVHHVEVGQDCVVAGRAIVVNTEPER